MTRAARVAISGRARQLRSLWQDDGLRGIADRARRAAARWLQPPRDALPVLARDVMAADLANPFRPSWPGPDAAGRLTLNWVMTPPAPGSGGHRTLFRVLHHLQGAGHTSRVYLYDVHRGDAALRAAVVREHYGFEGLVADATKAMADASAVVATSWPTAYAVYNARCAGKRFYFVQDFEPSFYPAGGLSALAEATYSMGFHGITAGRWLTEKLRDEFAMQADWFDFGCDTDCYRRDPGAVRRGVAFYAKPDTPRRACELGLLALEVFHRRRPDIEIHVYPHRLRGQVAFPIVDHGLVTPDELSSIYNRCYAALSLSMTNVSLVPYEMLAAGCIPVVNDAEHNRVVLDNPYVRYAPPAPHALAAALETIVELDDFERVSQAAAASVTSRPWALAGEAVERILRREVGRGSSRAASLPG